MEYIENNVFDLQNKVILLTGSNGSIASTLIPILKKYNAYVIGLDISSNINDNLDEFYICNVEKTNELEEVHKQFQYNVNCIINNVGAGIADSISNLSNDDFLYMMNVNTLSAWNVTREFLNDLKMCNQCAKIINMTSILSEHPVPHMTAYATAKASLIGFTKSLAIELANTNILVNAIELGYCNTQNNSDYFASKYGKYFIKRFIPRKKLVRKESVALLISFLCSDLSDDITGSIIRIDNGECIW